MFSTEGLLLQNNPLCTAFMLKYIVFLKCRHRDCVCRYYICKHLCVKLRLGLNIWRNKAFGFWEGGFLSSNVDVCRQQVTGPLLPHLHYPATGKYYFWTILWNSVWFQIIFIFCSLIIFLTNWYMHCLKETSSFVEVLWWQMSIQKSETT